MIRVIGMAEKKPAVEIWAMLKGVLGEVEGEKVRTRDFPTSKPQKDTATASCGFVVSWVREEGGGRVREENVHIGVTPTRGAETPA